MSCKFSGFSLQDVLILTSLQSRTGELELEAGNNMGTILFHEGCILFAFSPYSRAIGDLLVEDGVITDGELIQALKVQKNGPHVPIGSILIQTGKVSFDIIEMMVHEQIRRSLTEFATWKGMNFHFNEKAMMPYDTIHLKVSEFISAEVLTKLKLFLDRHQYLRSRPAPQPTVTPAS